MGSSSSKSLLQLYVAAKVSTLMQESGNPTKGSFPHVSAMFKPFFEKMHLCQTPTVVSSTALQILEGLQVHFQKCLEVVPQRRMDKHYLHKMLHRLKPHKKHWLIGPYLPYIWYYETMWNPLLFFKPWAMFLLVLVIPSMNQIRKDSRGRRIT